MSLDRSQQQATGEDLRRHLEASGLTTADLAGWLDLPAADIENALSMSGADPLVVWQVRDALDQVTRPSGGEGDWSVLTEANRRRAQQWFRLRDVPPRP